jgi:transposase-like protein
MSNCQNAVLETPQFTEAASVATILPTSTAMPMECDSCDQDNTYSIAFLRSLPELTCKHCGDHRQFSSFELNIIESTLKNMGYFLAKKAKLLN